jgi:hypothetical protein
MPHRAKIAIFVFCHSGLDPWFERRTTLSKVEVESIAYQSVTPLDALDAGSGPA